MGRVVIGSYHQVVDPDTSFGAQIRYSFVDRQPVLTLGVEHRFEPHLWFKARADTTGRVTAVFKWFCLSVLGDFRALHIPRAGLGIALQF